MKIDIVECEITDEHGLQAKVTMIDEHVAEVTIGPAGKSHTAESWRELADKVSEVLDLMFPT